MAAMMHSVQHSQFITEDETIPGITPNVCQKEDDNRGEEVRVLWCNWSSILIESLFTLVGSLIVVCLHAKRLERLRTLKRRLN